MTSSEKFEDLAVYQKALQFVMAAYGLIAVLQNRDDYGLANLIKQAAVSITSNISESSKKQSADEKERRLHSARHAIEECRYYLNFTGDQGYADTSSLLQQLKEVEILLEEYLRYL